MLASQRPLSAPRGCFNIENFAAKPSPNAAAVRLYRAVASVFYTVK
jgi:hypothetical protein